MAYPTKENWLTQLHAVLEGANSSMFVNQLLEYFQLVVEGDANHTRVALCNFTACLVWEYAAHGLGQCLHKETLSCLLKSLANSINCQIELHSVQQSWNPGHVPALPSQQICINSCTICLREAKIDWLQSALCALQFNRISLNEVLFRGGKLIAISPPRLDRIFETLDQVSRSWLWALLHGDLYDEVDRRLGYAATHAYKSDQLKEALERDSARFTKDGTSTGLCVLGALGLDQTIRPHLEVILRGSQAAGLIRHFRRFKPVETSEGVKEISRLQL